MKRGGSTYIMANKNNTTLYVGVTANLKRRIHQHKSGINPKSFTKRYNINKLVYFEEYPTIKEAIFREKQLKSGSRKKKESLINGFNPEWRDLYDEL
jgi:putative endonuclease